MASTLDATDGCRHRFEAAVEFIGKYRPQPGGESSMKLDDSTKLAFYGLYKSATEGPCRAPRPSMFDPVGRAKFDAWAANGSKSKEQAMVDYVSLLDKLHARWRLWDGIPPAYRAAVQVPATDFQSPPRHAAAAALPQSVPQSERSAFAGSTGIYGDFTNSSSVGGGEAAAPSPGGTRSLVSPASPLITSDMSPSVLTPSSLHVLNASAIEGSSVLTRSSNVSAEDRGDDAAPVSSSSTKADVSRDPTSAVRTAIRWSLSPNSEPDRRTPQRVATAVDSRRLSSVQIAEMCSSLSQRVATQRAELAAVAAALEKDEGQLAALQAAYPGALTDGEASRADGVSARSPHPKAHDHKQRGLLVWLSDAFFGWTSQLLRRRRLPLAVTVLIALVVLLVLRLQRGTTRHLL